MGTLAIVFAAAMGLMPQALARQDAPSATPSSARREADAALARKDWAAAVEALSRADRTEPLAPSILLGLGSAHAGAGHELAAMAWLYAYLTIAPTTEAERSRVMDDIVRLQVLAEARIRRILQEGADALEDIGETDPLRAARVQQLALTGALVIGDLPGAQAMVLRAAADPTRRDQMWTDAASALAADEDFAHAIDAAGNIGDGSTRDQLTRGFQEQQAREFQMSLPERWLSLARRLSERVELVDPDRELADIARATPADIPIRLLTMGSKLRAAYGRIQERAAEGRPSK